MIKFLKSLPFYAMLIILSIIYFFCGYIIGYYNGYQEAIQIKVDN
jgi:hypothetical protein